MRLINVHTGTLEHFHGNFPPYAILSHTWGTDEEEISFQDLKGGGVLRQGFGKVKFDGCCKRAKDDGLNYAWIDTCCIDKTNSTELSEAINSMYLWYENARACYAFLADVTVGNGTALMAEFRTSRWFERGWTLQELLAPGDVVFFDKDWHQLGSKRQFAGVVGEITGIPPPFLLGLAKLHEASVAQRMSWAAGRVTKRKEDMAYSLLGLFNVMIPLIYGEGERAFIRLQEEIMRKTPDDSILAWGLATGSDSRQSKNSTTIVFGKALAARPADFADSGRVVSFGGYNPTIEATGLSRGFLHVRLPLHTQNGQTFGLLQCRPRDDNDSVVAIPLHCVLPGERSDEYTRPEGSKAILLSGIFGKADAAKHIRIHESMRSEEATNYNRRYGFYIELPFSGELDLIEVEPQSRWEKEKAFIFTGVDFQHDSVQCTWVRIRQNKAASQDFVVALELEVKESQPHARCHVMVASRDTGLGTIADLPSLRKHVFGNLSASNGSVHLQVTSNQEQVGSQPMFVARLTLLADAPRSTLDASVELQLVRHSLRLQSVFQEDANMRQDMDEILAHILERKNLIHKTRARLESVKQELDRLRGQEARLLRILDRSIPSLESLSRKNETLLKKDVLKTDQLLSSARELPASCGDERAAQWQQEMLDYLSDTIVIKERPSISSMDDKTQRVFMQAAAGGYLAVMKFLDAELCDLSFEDHHGNGILSTAISGRNLSEVRWLVEEKGLDVGRRDRRGHTPLCTAVRCGFLAGVTYLLDHGADIEDNNSDGTTPLTCAARRNRTEIIRLLLERKADVEGKHAHNWRPLLVAAVAGHHESVQLLLEHGAFIEAEDVDGNTSLTAAAANGHYRVAQLLLQQGANVDPNNSSGNTPLVVAAQGGHEDVVRLLLDRGADSESIYRDSKSLSRLQEMPDIVQQLEKANERSKIGTNGDGNTTKRRWWKR